MRIVATNAATAAAKISVARLNGSFRNQRAARQGEQLPLARRDGGAEKADPQRQMLNDRPRGRNADAEELAEQDFEDGEERHRRQREAGGSVFKNSEPAHHLAAGAAAV